MEGDRAEIVNGGELAGGVQSVCAWHKAGEISNKSVAARRNGPGIAPPIYPRACAWVRSFQGVGYGLSPMIRSVAIVTQGGSSHYERIDTLVMLSAMTTRAMMFVAPRTPDGRGPAAIFRYEMRIAGLNPLIMHIRLGSQRCKPRTPRPFRRFPC
jgi:hypothetical protein